MIIYGSLSFYLENGLPQTMAKIKLNDHIWEMTHLPGIVEANRWKMAPPHDNVGTN
jgi:hypothetical protein